MTEFDKLLKERMLARPLDMDKVIAARKKQVEIHSAKSRSSSGVKRKEQRRRWYEAHREEQLERMKQLHRENREAYNEYHKNWAREHKERTAEAKKKYYKAIMDNPERREEFKAKKKEYHKGYFQRLKADPIAYQKHREKAKENYRKRKERAAQEDAK